MRSTQRAQRGRPEAHIRGNPRGPRRRPDGPRRAGQPVSVPKHPRVHEVWLRGLTATYNRLRDPDDERDPDLLRLRELHAAMGRAVLDAYGWTDALRDEVTRVRAEQERMAQGTDDPKKLKKRPKPEIP